MLQESDCSASAWRALQASVEVAARSGSQVVGTPHLFLGLSQEPEGPLTHALRRLGVSFAAPALATGNIVALSGEVSCSENLANILLEAQASAAADGRLVSTDDLLAAFVRGGGGQLGDLMAQHGFTLEALTSQLFVDGGDLDLVRFDPEAQSILEAALECARRKRYPALGRRHLLYGALCLRDGYLARRLRELGRDAELLADQWYAEMATGTSRTLLKLGIHTMSRDLVSILCLAETDARTDRTPLVGIVQLLRAWMADGGGEAGSFLARNGVKLRDLV
jgi:ATP-dependent Clp protease ATP-binding subunit ClpA